MKFRGLKTVVTERDAQGHAARREAFITTVFAQGLATDARPLLRLVAMAHSGEGKVPPNAGTRAARRAALLSSAN